MSAQHVVLEVRAVAWDDPVAVELREAMTRELRPRYADRSDRTMPPRMVVDPAEVLYTGVACHGDLGVGHIALRYLPGSSHRTQPPELEIKRMYVAASVRGQGIGRLLLSAAERVAAELGARRVVLQTGDRQPEAAALYSSSGYTRIPVLQPYLALPLSLCFEKALPFEKPPTSDR